MIIRDITPNKESATKIKGLATQLNDVEDELDRCDPLTPQHPIFLGLAPHASSTLPNLAQFNEARGEATRVSTSPTTLRVLPTWTHRPRVENSNSNLSLRCNIGQKRNSSITIDHVDLPSK